MVNVSENCYSAHSPSGAPEVSAAAPDPEMRNAGRRAAAPTRERGIPEVWGLTRAVFWEAPAFLLSFWASGRPNFPFSPCGRRGWGDEGQKPSLPRAFINERSRAFGQPGYDLDPAVEFECIV